MVTSLFRFKAREEPLSGLSLRSDVEAQGELGVACAGLDRALASRAPLHCGGATSGVPDGFRVSSARFAFLSWPSILSKAPAMGVAYISTAHR